MTSNNEHIKDYLDKVYKATGQKRPPAKPKGTGFGWNSIQKHTEQYPIETLEFLKEEYGDE